MPTPPHEQALDSIPASSGELVNLQRAGTNLLPRFIKAEANLLRLPLFALQTKGLKTLDGIECRGTTTRNGETHQFILTAARSTITPYPGPLARAAHLAFLSIATDRGFPIENPISWSWYDLCKRMGIASSGRSLSQLKAAIESTKALFIRSHYAIYSKPEERLLRTSEDSLNLYDRVSFVGSELPGGGLADTNYLWLSGWYLDNLNAMFTAPVDYELWRWLDRQSPIASRLYEFLIINFYRGMPKLCINYGKLAQYLPVRPMAYRSLAKQQFDPAFTLLALTDVIETATWSDSKSDIAQVNIYPGRRLASADGRPASPLQLAEEEFDGAFEVQELRNLKPAEWSLVTAFYQSLSGATFSQPTKKELEQAKALLAEHGAKKANDLIPRVVKILKQKWPEAKSFGAITRYLPEAATAYDRDQNRIEREQQDQLKRQREREEKVRIEAEKAKILAAWQPVWASLTEAEQEAIRAVALSGGNRFLLKIPRLAEQVCLFELARQRGADVPAELWQ